MHAEPIASGWREHTACGTTSPKMTMVSVDIRKPAGPEVKSAMTMERMQLTATFPE